MDQNRAGLRSNNIGGLRSIKVVTREYIFSPLLSFLSLKTHFTGFGLVHSKSPADKSISYGRRLHFFRPTAPFPPADASHERRQEDLTPKRLF